jgi:hypothetical protein
MPRILKHPLLWFCVIASILFAADSWLSVSRNEIYVSVALRERLGLLWETQTGMIASQDELNSLVQNWIEEEVLFQEALRLGLDQEDSIVRRRMIQKLNFIAESEPVAVPETRILENFYSRNLQDYTLPRRYSMRQLYFQTRPDARSALAAIDRGEKAASLGESSMLSSSYAYRSSLDLNATFGSGFADQLKNLSANSWHGPLKSSFGYHLVLVTGIHEQEVTPLRVISDQVLTDYRQSRQDSARERYLANLRLNYEIVVEQQ